jgi:hypothetical protein
MAQPCNTDLFPNMTGVPARMEPSRILFAPMVAAVPRAHRTFSAFRQVEIVTRVLPAMKRNSGFGSFIPYNVTTVPYGKLISRPDL